MNDSQLVQECLKGKRDSQKRLYEQYAPKMLGVCYRYASSRDEAEDYLQDAFITIFRKLNQWKGEGELGAWIRRIVVNTSLNGIKAKHRLSEYLSDTSPEEIPDIIAESGNENADELMELVRQLPLGYKTVFNLYAIEGYSHEEIGKMLNIQTVTSRSQFMKARKMLMQKLNSEPGQTVKN